MKTLISAIALLSFVGAATVPAVAFADDAAPAAAKKTAKHKSTKTAGAKTSSKKSKSKAKSE
jgi:hypothetical protein